MPSSDPPRPASNDTPPILASPADNRRQEAEKTNTELSLPGGRKNRWGLRWAVGLLLLAVLGPLLWKAGQLEIARWYQAAALEQELQNDNDGAIAMTNKAIAWDPDNPYLHNRLAQYEIRGGDADAAAASAERALELSRAAFQTAKTPNNFGSLLLSLNQTAYAYALQNKNIDSGLDLIGEYFDATSRPSANALDTRGYLSYLAGDYGKAYKDIEAAVASTEGNYSRRLINIRRDAKMRVDRRSAARQEKNLSEERAVLYQHRGLVYKALGRKLDAERDFARAKKFGYNPAEGVW